MPLHSRSHAVALLLVLFLAVAAADTSVKYASSNTPVCADALAESLSTLYGRNRNIYERCVAETNGYSLLPYSGYLPNDDQIIAIASSPSCLQFFLAATILPDMAECNLGGIDLLSALETLLMTAQDIVLAVAPLTSTQFVEFITWRHVRNIAKASGLPYDGTSASAIAFEEQLSATANRFNVTLDNDLQLLVNGAIVGSTDVPSEQRSLDSSMTTTASSMPSINGGEVAKTVASGATTKTAILPLVTVVALVLALGRV